MTDERFVDLYLTSDGEMENLAAPKPGIKSAADLPFTRLFMMAQMTGLVPDGENRYVGGMAIKGVDTLLADENVLAHCRGIVICTRGDIDDVQPYHAGTWAEFDTALRDAVAGGGRFHLTFGSYT